MPPAKSRRKKLKNNTRLVAATGWAWLIISLLLALFFGGAVRALLSERQVRQWIERTWQKENPPYQLQFKSAKVELADGWRPHFGLRVRGLELSPLDPCRHDIKLQIDNLFLPGPLDVIWGGRLKFGEISASKVKVLRIGKCEKTTVTATGAPEIAAKVATPSSGTSLATSSLPPEAEKYLRERWGQELVRTSGWLKGVVIDEIEVEGLASPFSQMYLKNIDLVLAADGSAAMLKTQVAFKGQMNDALAGGNLQVEAFARVDSLEARIYIPVREGRITVTATSNFASMDYIGAFNFDFVPAASLIEILKLGSVITDPITLKRAWLTGQGRWQGKLLKAPAVESIFADNLKLSGDAGSVQVQALELKPEGQTLAFKPFNVRLDDFSLRYLLEALGRKGYTGVLNDFGHLTGDLQVVSRDDLSFRGELEDLSINFSRQSVRTTQKVNLLRGALDLKGQRVSGLVKDIELDEGVLRGQASFNLDRQVLNGVFQIKVDELQFRPEVQRLMTGGTIAPIALYGQGQLGEGQVKQWSGEVGSKEINGNDWKVENLKVRSEFANHLMILQVRTDKFSLLEGNQLNQQFQPILAKGDKPVTDLDLQHLSARIEVGSGVTRWRNAAAATVGGDYLFATTGKFENGQAEAVISVDTKQAKMVRWSVLGPWHQLQISPASAPR